jgi:hypothetical protein
LGQKANKLLIYRSKLYFILVVKNILSQHTSFSSKRNSGHGKFFAEISGAMIELKQTALHLEKLPFF